MRTARLRHLLEIQRRAPAGAGFEPSNTWESHTSLWAEKRDPRGREISAGLQTNSVMSVVFRTHYRDDVNSSHRVVFGERIFDIKAATNPDGRGQWLLLHCVEHQSVGD